MIENEKLEKVKKVVFHNQGEVVSVTALDNGLHVKIRKIPSSERT